MIAIHKTREMVTMLDPTNTKTFRCSVLTRKKVYMTINTLDLLSTNNDYLVYIYIIHGWTLSTTNEPGYMILLKDHLI